MTTENSPQGVLTLEPSEGETDYILDENATSCWITVGDISVYILRLDGGAVAVELLPLHDEASDPLDTCYAEPR